MSIYIKKKKIIYEHTHVHIFKNVFINYFAITFHVIAIQLSFS
jgi:hypothetical protein